MGGHCKWLSDPFKGRVHTELSEKLPVRLIGSKPWQASHAAAVQSDASNKHSLPQSFTSTELHSSHLRDQIWRPGFHVTSSQAAKQSLV